MKLKNLLFIASLLFITACCKSTEQKIVIVSTNDIHSAIDRFPALATLVDSLRQENPNLLLIDAGDRRTGNPYVDIAAKQGYPIIELMNSLGYDIATFGNHEFDKGTDTLAKRISETNFKYILANITTNGSIPQPTPYIIKQIGGIKIGFVGLITNFVNGHPDGNTESFGNATFTDPFTTAEQYQTLADSCDLLVALTHIGVVPDSIIATRAPRYGLIIGGHSHNVIPEGKIVGNTLITQAGNALKYAGVTTITIKDKKVVNITNKLVDLRRLDPSPKYASMVETYKQSPELKKIVGSTLSTINKTALLNLMSDIMLVGSKAEVALFNLGSVRLDSISKGDIMMADIFAVEPFGNSPYIVEMSADELKSMIINKYNSEGKESHVMDIYPSGMSYIIVKDDNGEAIDVIIKFAGKTGKTIKVAMSDYMHNTYDFNKRGCGTPTNLMITDLMIEYLGKNSPLNVSPNSRVEIATK